MIQSLNKIRLPANVGFGQNADWIDYSLFRLTKMPKRLTTMVSSTIDVIDVFHAKGKCYIMIYTDLNQDLDRASRPSILNSKP